MNKNHPPQYQSRFAYPNPEEPDEGILGVVARLAGLVGVFALAVIFLVAFL